MEEINQPAPKVDTTRTAAATPDGYAPVTGRSLEDVEKLRVLEGQAAEKAARDYEHIVWAYGVLWALFAAYGIFLWRRSARLRADMDSLRRSLESRGRA
ncbi:MAG: hypothetical protein JNL82_18120 [Myxococcales bacterium]|nr:hypothetical protein [Myxococcales bacterium]